MVEEKTDEGNRPPYGFRRWADKLACKKMDVAKGSYNLKGVVRRKD